MSETRLVRSTRSRHLSPLPHYNSDSSRKRRKRTSTDSDAEKQNLDLLRANHVPDSAHRQQRLRMSTTLTTPAPVPRAQRDIPSAAPLSSSTAAAAIQANDYKPREEKSWEEFHPDLDIDASITVFSADEVDGVTRDEHTGDITNGISPLKPATNDELSSETHIANHVEPDSTTPTSSPFKRRPGRPPRRPESMLTGLGSPPTPRIIPLPTQNPKERLNLPKPSFRKIDTFTTYEADRDVQVNYVDSQMANAGFQETELFLRPDKRLLRLGEAIPDEHILLGHRQDGPRSSSTTAAQAVTQVEYDMDEQDQQWLDAYNAYRKSEGVPPVKPAVFEITMTQIEKEWHALEKRIPKPNSKPPQTQRPRSSSAAAVNGEVPVPGEEQDSKCAICDDGDCENTNAIVFCDGCDLAVHQECYGVPFIPEGQWLCRKCQMIGRGVPTCIFCPNTDGAFKLTNESRWVHLLCAIWIPEVSIGNMTFMEPIMDVAKVPKQRWKLNCYICNQKMGACIQCGNKNCYQAFHVSCARKAKLYLKMKSTHGGPSSIDASVLKAFCDKHVPQEWRNEHDVDSATAAAKRFYRKTMKGRQWADSQQAALAQVTSYSHFEPVEPGSEALQQEATSPNSKRKRQQLQKNIWRLPSGAPIVPRAVFNKVESSLTKFELRRRKDYAADACKYWTLKREARRGASLLKRLQLQLDTFSTTEVARRDFVGMGAAGGPRLQRRIEFAEQLLVDMEKLKEICENTKDRESMKLRDAELLKSVVNTVYFPIPSLLWPILEKAQRLDTKGFFWIGFKSISAKLEAHAYSSVASFSVDIGAAFRSAIALDSASKDSQAPSLSLHDHIVEGNPIADQKEVKKLAKRIVKAIQQPLLEATRKEAELAGRPYEKELKNLEALLDSSVDDVPVEGVEVASEIIVATYSLGQDVRHANALEDVEMIDKANGHSTASENNILAKGSGKPWNLLQSKEAVNIPTEKVTDDPHLNHPGLVNAPLTPPSSEKDKDPLAPLTNGGIPWYLESFDPLGTTIHEERWPGRDVMRGMSEELSELDEDELKGLGVVDDVVEEPIPASTRKPPKKKKRRSFW